MTDLEGNRVSDVKTEWKNEGNYTYVKVSAEGMKNGQIYVINLIRTVKINGESYTASTREYGYPQAAQQSVKINVKPGDHMVKLSVSGFPEGISGL